MFLELHIIQNFSPSNLNRDDTNNPKDCEFGGVRRARISSQCIKRSIRREPIFEATTDVPSGIRTRWVTRMFTKALVKAGKPEEEAQQAAETFAAKYSKMDTKQAGRTSVLLYLSANEIDMVVQEILANWDDREDKIDSISKKIIKQTKERTSAPDIALFGRMMAEKPDLSIDAACQVSHAISTHRVNMEMDFYTAVDDLQTDEEAGAGMMGVVPFNSACYYRYARIDWAQLVSNLDNDVDLAHKATEGFLWAAVRAVPTGKQTSFAAQNPPSFLLAVPREDGQSWSLMNAFEKPIRPERDGGIIAPSIKALDSYWGKLEKTYGNGSVNPISLSLEADPPLEHLSDTQMRNLDAWVNAILEKLPTE
jgi:CRISPR system Cascade subunit CasC